MERNTEIEIGTEADRQTEKATEMERDTMIARKRLKMKL